MNEEKLTELQREVQQLKSQVLEQSAHINDLRARMIEVSEMIEKKYRP